MKTQAERDGLGGGGGGWIRLCGVLIPSVWDDQGRIESVSLATHEEKEIRIIQDVMGKAALGMVRREVEIEGFLESGPEGPALRVVGIRSVN